MQFKRRIKIERGLGAIDIAPWLNILFLLFIFLMFSSSFTFPSGIKVQLPKALTSDLLKEKNLIITITSENVIYVNDKVLNLAELQRELSKDNYKDSPILIQADRRASVGRIVDVWDLCRGLGIERINIATNQKK